MFIRIWELIILYIGGTGGPGIWLATEGTGGGAFANKNCLQGPAFEIFFSNARGMPGGLPGGGMLAAGIDSHIRHNSHWSLGSSSL